jgi:hypothetical protein
MNKLLTEEFVENMVEATYDWPLFHKPSLRDYADVTIRALEKTHGKVYFRKPRAKKVKDPYEDFKDYYNK